MPIKEFKIKQPLNFLETRWIGYLRIGKENKHIKSEARPLNCPEESW
jgi:hypothetical protein